MGGPRSGVLTWEDGWWLKGGLSHHFLMGFPMATCLMGRRCSSAQWC
uniref:Uncharacterized protein n=1 Tax=Arundo donax TaxID=35708 RepID=A0A0A9FA97_ARUDO